ncbi:hypothetical protein AYL44_09805 [Microbacterium oleivorans]|uniref:Antigen I/II N-terminal domain-containing protein n=2 Tax=Microbacterium oleivorans TaxID=273677 RepID=A0A177KB81_9MICO|nr:hypothetical protein AYL44_09805 [Microbacterium oleivorans]
MKIRHAIISFTAAGALLLGGCAAAGDEATSSAPATPAAIEVDEQLTTVDVKVAKSMLDPEGTLTDDEIIASAKEKGLSAVVEGDTVVYTMTKSQRDEMLADMRSSARESADELVADDTNSVTAVDFNDAMTSFTVSVDPAKYNAMEGFLVLGFYMQGALFQQFTGVAADDIDVTVDFVDNSTGEVLDSGSFQEMRDNLDQ